MTQNITPKPSHSREPLDEYFAVFNGHINHADRRARKIMQASCPSYLAQVKRIEKKGGGIMAIFDRPPTRATRRYVSLVTQFVNEE